MRMTSGPSVTAWGWAVDYISIQILPVSTEPIATAEDFSLYPNPTRGAFTIDYNLSKATEVSLSVVNIFGHTLHSKSLGMKNAGRHTEPVEIDNVSAGTYMIILNIAGGKKVGKLVLSNTD
jgi:hypothetical protein